MLARTHSATSGVDFNRMDTRGAQRRRCTVRAQTGCLSTGRMRTLSCTLYATAGDTNSTRTFNGACGVDGMGTCYKYPAEMDLFPCRNFVPLGYVFVIIASGRFDNQSSLSIEQSSGPATGITIIINGVGCYVA
jgi:hypothetical protein